MDISSIKSGSSITAPNIGNKTEKSGDVFNSVLSNAIDRTNDTIKISEESVKNLASGKVENPHEVMINLEEAHIALQWALQVRNRVVEAYNEVMRMQI